MIAIFLSMTVLFGLTLLGTLFILPESIELNLFLLVFFLGLASWTLFLVKKKALHQWTMGKKNIFYKFQTAMGFFLLMCLLSMVNYWASKFPKQGDFSAGRVNSLTTQSQLIVKNLKAPLTVTIYSTKKDLSIINALIELYKNNFPDIKVIHRDPEIYPSQISHYGFKNNLGLVLSYKNREVPVSEIHELGITKALIQLARPSEPVIYSVVGHGEGDFYSNEKNGLSKLNDRLNGDVLKIRPLNLLETGIVPADASALLIMGPQKDFMMSELEAVKKYMERGGKLLVALDPQFNGETTPELKKLMEVWGLKINNDLVVDKKKYVNGSAFTVPLIENYNAYHPITMGQKEQTFFPLSRSLEFEGDSHSEFAYFPLAYTSVFPNSWAEKNFYEVFNNSIKFNSEKQIEKSDMKGPIPVMVALEEKKEGTSFLQGIESSQKKIVAIGNSTFIHNMYGQYQSNANLFVRALNWLLETPFSLEGFKVESVTPIILSAQHVQSIFYFSVIFAPLGLLALGLSLYFFRRH
jgi:ABC-type uncharacterized transport system involved in gliding motility auxiliary subunit